MSWKALSLLCVLEPHCVCPRCSHLGQPALPPCVEALPCPVSELCLALPCPALSCPALPQACSLDA